MVATTTRRALCACAALLLAACAPEQQAENEPEAPDATAGTAEGEHQPAGEPVELEPVVLTTENWTVTAPLRRRFPVRQDGRRLTEGAVVGGPVMMEEPDGSLHVLMLSFKKRDDTYMPTLGGPGWLDLRVTTFAEDGTVLEADLERAWRHWHHEEASRRQFGDLLPDMYLEGINYRLTTAPIPATVSRVEFQFGYLQQEHEGGEFLHSRPPLVAVRR